MTSQQELARTAAGAPQQAPRQAPQAPTPEYYRHRDDCRACGSRDVETVIDLGATPLANRFLAAEDLGRPEPIVPLAPSRCRDCGLVQLLDVADPSVLFDEYLYFSSASPPVIEHFRTVAADLLERYRLGADDLVCEIGSNDGVFLQHFVGRARVLGVDPARNIAPVAAQKGVPTLTRFFDPAVAREIRDTHGEARLVFAANVLAHIDDIAGVVQGIADLLAPDGVLVFEVHRLLDLLQERHFDQFYHEHVCYWSLQPLERLLARFGLRVIDVQLVAMQGESYQVHAVRNESMRPATWAVDALREEERRLGLEQPETYRRFGDDVRASIEGLRTLVEQLRSEGRRIAGYGAPAKATTLLGAAGLDARHIAYITDTTPAKQGRYMPASHIPIRAPEALVEDAPDDVLLLAWNFADSILAREQGLRDRGIRFIVPLPEAHIVE